MHHNYGIGMPSKNILQGQVRFIHQFPLALIIYLHKMKWIMTMCVDII